MTEQEEVETTESAASAEKKARTPRTFASRAERSLKETERLLKKNPDMPEGERATVVLEQAKVLALLEVADAFRQNGSS